MKTLIARSNGMARVTPAGVGGVRDWQRWAPYAAVAWSLIYAALGAYWAVSGRGFPYTPETVSNPMGPLVGRLGPVVAWIVVISAGLPAVAMERRCCVERDACGPSSLQQEHFSPGSSCCS